MDDPDGLSFLGFSCPARLRLRTVILQPGDALEFRPEDWLATLAVVERGELEVECRSGQLARFGAGSVLAFTGLSLRYLRNAGDAPLVLSALSRAAMN